MGREDLKALPEWRLRERFVARLEVEERAWAGL